jgi:aerobic-type carbon monoxide dehydrogenase small subunit (CoxS/CutS family)
LSFFHYIRDAEARHTVLAEIREMLAGHLCRCTGYEAIVAAIAAAAARA